MCKKNILDTAEKQFMNWKFALRNQNSVQRNRRVKRHMGQNEKFLHSIYGIPKEDNRENKKGSIIEYRLD